MLEYFARTRYSDLIRPEALKEWNGVGNHFGPEIVEGGSPEPSHACWDRVTKRLFHALSAEDLAQVVQGYDNEWAVASDKYKEAMKTMYGGLDTERCVNLEHTVIFYIDFCTPRLESWRRYRALLVQSLPPWRH